MKLTHMYNDVKSITHHKVKSVTINMRHSEPCLLTFRRVAEVKSFISMSIHKETNLNHDDEHRDDMMSVGISKKVKKPPSSQSAEPNRLTRGSLSGDPRVESNEEPRDPKDPHL